MNTTTHNGRVYLLTADSADLPNLKADLLRRGFDGAVYQGVSIATGRQRKDFRAVFFRSVKSGSFVAAA